MNQFADKSTGFLTVSVLEFLRGHPWDDVARAFVCSLRPSKCRVSTGEVKSDSMLWCVTVFIDEDEIIDRITQEVMVELPAWMDNGYQLAVEFEKRQRQRRKRK